VPSTTLFGFVDRMRTLTGDLRTALAAAVCAAERLTAPVPVPDEMGRLRPAGRYLTGLMLDAARNTAGPQQSRG